MAGKLHYFNSAMYAFVDPRSSTPVYVQLKDQIRLAIAAGSLAPGEQLPTHRELAGQLRVNPNTIARVYRDLQTEGLFTARTGSGTFVAEEAPALAAEQARREVGERLAELARTGLRLRISAEELSRLFGEALIQAAAAPQPDKGAHPHE